MYNIVNAISKTKNDFEKLLNELVTCVIIKIIIIFFNILICTRIRDFYVITFMKL